MKEMVRIKERETEKKRKVLKKYRLLPACYDFYGMYFRSLLHEISVKMFYASDCI